MGSKKFDPTDHNTYKHYGKCRHIFHDNAYCKIKGCTVYKWVWDYYLMWVRTKGKFNHPYPDTNAEKDYVSYLLKDLKRAYKGYRKDKNTAEIMSIVEDILDHSNS